MALRFVLDENLRGPMWQAILQHNLRKDQYPLDVVRVGDSPELPLSSDDGRVLSWAEREQRILITEDRQTIASHLHSHTSQGHNSPGILIPRASQSIRTLIECLLLIAYVGEPAEFADSITYFP
jgi:hypothetical protein